jgi:gluconate 2-dehydrogenase gamma chain
VEYQQLQRGAKNMLNRRTFLIAGCAASAAGLSAVLLPSIASMTNRSSHYFSDSQRETLRAVQMQLFPDDGNGPGAEDIHAMDYLEWAMTDPKNISDGDPEFIAKGIGWLDDLAIKTEQSEFKKLTNQQKEKLLQQIATSQAGENWLSLLMYYLTEALMLDPAYGGNPNGIGWNWLEHQAGFPQPIKGKTYRDFENEKHTIKS